MKCKNETFRQWFSKANAIATWRKRLWRNTQSTFGKLGPILTIHEDAFTPPVKDLVKEITLIYIGDAQDEKTLSKHIKRVALVLEIVDFADTHTQDPTYTLNLGRLELKVKLQGFKLETEVTEATTAPTNEDLAA